MEHEFDEMRRQMAILKEKIETQTKVNDRVLRRSLKRGVSTINKRYLIISICALAMIPYGYWAFVKLNGMSVALWLASCVLMLAVVAFNYLNGRDLRDPKLPENSLLETKRKVAAAKRRDGNWLWFGIPVVLVWATWAVWELVQKMGYPEYVIPAAAVCILAGVAVGLKVHFKTQHHYREILEQIEDMEDTE